MTVAPAATGEMSRADLIASLPRRERRAYLTRKARQHGLTVEEMVARVRVAWEFRARPKQLAPPGDWMFWFVMAGRGFGKTLTGAEWTKKKGLERRCRIALVGPTLGDVRDTMIEGETGILSVLSADQLLGGSRSTGYNRTQLQVTLANGTILKGFSSEEPNRLRGPQHHYAWGEEISSWNDAGAGLDEPDSTFFNMKVGLRLGSHPQAILTSTPKTNVLTRELVALGASGSDLVLVRGSSYENRANLSPVYWQIVVAPLEGKRAGRQEIHAEIIDDVEGALWTKAQIDRLRVRLEDVPPLARIVVAVDPNVSSSAAADAAGIIVVGQEARPDRRMNYVLADLTVTSGGPKRWASAAVDAYHEWEADRLVAEINNGGELVEMAVRNLDRSISYSPLHATRGKRIRAEPISALYEGDFDDPYPPAVRHAGVFVDLEDELTTWVPGEQSPNRLDAMVWGLTELTIGPNPGSGRTSVPRGRIPGVEARGRPPGAM